MSYSDLRTALQSLSDQSLKASRRLDDTYYSILEKVSILLQTIKTLQELSGLTRDLQSNFESDTRELVEDVTGQVDAFDNFQSSQDQVSALEQRIKAGKQKADALTARLARARDRVNERAKTEAQWEVTNTRMISNTLQHKTQTANVSIDRLRMFWGILASIAALVIALVLFHHLKPVYTAGAARPALDFTSRSAVLEAQIPDIAKEAIIGPHTSSKSASSETTSSQRSLADDKRLRGFDEL